MLYLLIFVVLLMAELIYFRIADKCNIIDKPNQRSSHSKVVLRGGGVIFLVGTWVWSCLYGFQYPWMLAAVTLAAGISFVDDIHSLPDSLRLVVQFVAMGLMFYQLDILPFGYVVDRASCIDRMRGSDEHHQFYGWGEWNHGGIFVGGACSAAVDEPEDPVYGEFVFDCRDLVRSGVLPVQFPSEKPGEMFCRGCRKYRNCFYLIVFYREIGDTDRRYNMAVFSCCVRGGRLSYDLPSDYAS